MRAIWKGSIAFGHVHILVNLYLATETQSISSNLLHKKDHSRIRYQRISEATGKEVPAEEIVRGYEVERDKFVVISDDELKEASPEKSAAVEIYVEVVNREDRQVFSWCYAAKKHDTEKCVVIALNQHHRLVARTVIIGLVLERISRDGIGTACAAAIGFITLIIAHHLAGSADTLEMLQAVLETNIWLATHVVVVFQARISKRNRRDIRCTSSRGHKAAALFVSPETLVGFGPFFPYIGNLCSSNTCRIV
jgi:hypothetical protein